MLKIRAGHDSSVEPPGDERSGDRTLVSATFSAAVQTGSGALPVSFTMGTGQGVALTPTRI